MTDQRQVTDHNGKTWTIGDTVENRITILPRHIRSMSDDALFTMSQEVDDSTEFYELICDELEKRDRDQPHKMGSFYPVD